MDYSAQFDGDTFVVEAAGAIDMEAVGGWGHMDGWECVDTQLPVEFHFELVPAS